jgi:uncharacterized membrane protein YuzA (DUF378 family)
MVGLCNLYYLRITKKKKKKKKKNGGNNKNQMKNV